MDSQTDNVKKQIFLYDKSIKPETKTRPINVCRCDERLKTKTEESTHHTYTGLNGEVEHLKIKTRLINEKFASVMGEHLCDLDVMGVPSKLSVIRKVSVLTRMFPTRD